MKRLKSNILHNMEILRRIMENTLIRHVHRTLLGLKDTIIYWILFCKREIITDCYIREY